MTARLAHNSRIMKKAKQIRLLYGTDTATDADNTEKIRAKVGSVIDGGYIQSGEEGAVGKYKRYESGVCFKTSGKSKERDVADYGSSYFKRFQI